MASSINPNNIDGAYPVAGQDNNSQGFRDNFTNTKTNFQYAADEITDLQNKVVLKQALTGTTLNNDMLGSVLSNAQLQDMSETRVALGSLSGTVAINYAAGSYQTVQTNGSITLSFSSWPAAGALGVVAVQINVTSTAHTVTFPVNPGPTSLINAVGIQGFDSSTNAITFSTAGTYTFEFSSSDGGTTITVNETNQRLSAFNNSSEDLTNTAGANLALTTTYFTTAGSETGTLSAGAAGQIKVFSAVDVTAGNMVITVTNAGWKASGTGTITFSDRGQSCILQYTANKWFVIGSGPGASNTFAQLA
jgi:hypothetical protein